MSRPTSRVRFLTVEEFEARAVPALLGLSLPSAALHGLHGLLRAIDNGAPGLVGRIIPADPAPTPGGVIPADPAPVPGGGVTPTLPTLPTSPVGETPDPGPVVTPVASGEPDAGPAVFTPTGPVRTTPTASAPAAVTPTAAETTTESTTTSPAAAPATLPPDGAATSFSPAFPPTTPVGVGAVATTDAAPNRTSAPAAAIEIFQAERPPPAAIVTGPAALTGFPVDPEVVAVTPAEVVPPGVEVAPEAPAAVTPPVTIAVAVEAAVPEAVAAAAAEPEAWNLASWGWSAAVAAVAAGGYWVARRYQLARKLAHALFPPKLTVRV